MAIDPQGTLTQYAYDGFGNLVSKTADCCGAGHVNAVTTISYDPVGKTPFRPRMPTQYRDQHLRPQPPSSRLHGTARPAAAGSVVTTIPMTPTVTYCRCSNPRGTVLRTAARPIPDRQAWDHGRTPTAM